MSIGTIAIAFATLGGFLLVSVNLQSVLNRWLEAAEMSVYLVDGVTDEERSVHASGHPRRAGMPTKRPL